MRKQNVLRNVVVGILATIIQSILGFITRRIFVECLGQELLGLNGFLTSVISTLSLLELGVGSAIYCSLYGPLKDNNKEKINAIIHLYQRVYRYIGGGVLVVGLLLIPLLPVLIKSTINPSLVNRAYLFFLLDTVLSYFLGYYRTIISADQKEYIVTLVDALTQIVLSAAHVLVLLVWKSYYLYLANKLLFGLIRNILIRNRARHMYPEIKDKPIYSLDASYKAKLKADISALFLINVASYLVFSTDNILLSKAEGLSAVAIYGNYVTIITMLNSIVNNIMSRANSSVGNYLLTKTNKESQVLFERLGFINFLITGYSSVALFTVFNPFIQLWMGKDFVWPISIVAILVFNNYSRFIISTSGTFINGAGMYNPFPSYKYFSLMEGIVNLTFSALFIWGFGMGVYGVFLGTSVSTIVSTVIMPYVVHHYILFCSQRKYYLRYFEYLILTFFTSVISALCLSLLNITSSIAEIVVGLSLCTVCFIGTVYLLFKKTDEYHYFKDFLIHLFKWRNAQEEHAEQ